MNTSQDLPFEWKVYGHDTLQTWTSAWLPTASSLKSQPILAKQGFQVLTTAQGFEWKQNH